MIFNELYTDTLSPVAKAVMDKDVESLQLLLQNGYSTSLVDNRGWTPLHVAAKEGFVEAVQQLLIADDIRVDSLSHCGRSPLSLACCGKTDNHRKVVQLLLSAGADPDMTPGDNWLVPLHTATENNNVETVRLLLDAGADPNVIAFKNATALHAAADAGALEIAQLLLERGGDINITQKTDEYSALHCLCLNFKQDSETIYNKMLDLFLSHGSDINAQMNDGTTPLMLAVQQGWEWAMDQLLDKGVDVHLTKSPNILALHFAIQFNPESQKRSNDDGADEEGTSVLEKILSRTNHYKIPRDGFSIFHLAIQWKRYKRLRILIENGINPDDFLQEMEGAVIDCDDETVVPLVVKIHITHDTPLGFLLFQSLTREVVETAKYMINKGSSINALKPGVLPPLVAALKNRDASAYEDGGLGQEILQYLLAQGVDIMHKTRESDLLPDALTVSSLFNVVGFFRLLQHGVPAHTLYTHSTLTTLMQHYRSVPCYRAYKWFPWLVASWLSTVNLFIAQLPVDAVDIFNIDWDVADDNLTQAWEDIESLVLSPKSLQHLCVLKTRLVLGEARGWDKLQHSLKQLQISGMLPDPIVELLHLKWVKTATLHLHPPLSTRHLYVVTNLEDSSDDEL